MSKIKYKARSTRDGNFGVVNMDEPFMVIGTFCKERDAQRFVRALNAEQALVSSLRNLADMMYTAQRKQGHWYSADEIAKQLQSARSALTMASGHNVELNDDDERTIRMSMDQEKEESIYPEPEIGQHWIVNRADRNGSDFYWIVTGVNYDTGMVTLKSCKREQYREQPMILFNGRNRGLSLVGYNQSASAA